MPIFQSYPPNEHGHDFVVGDLHGRGQQLLDKLVAQGFDPTVDRVFCTGDLIDRSEHSFETLELLLGQPWVYFVRGNHEADLSNSFKFKDRFSVVKEARSMGKEWIYSLTRQQVRKMEKVYLPILADAPVVIRVQGLQGFWVVHADRGLFTKVIVPIPLLSDDDLFNEIDDEQLEALLWSRRLFKQIPTADLIDRGLFMAVERDEVAPRVGLTFVGHSTVK